MEITVSKNTLLFLVIGAVLIFISIIAMAVSLNKPTTVDISSTKYTEFPSNLGMGVSEMYVKDLAGMKTFYVDLVGLDIIVETDMKLELGHGTTPVITLIQKDGYKFVASGEAGLYHNAIVFSTRSALANAINTLLTSGPEYYQGSADHLVSEAFYFGDPEGNGVELYFDKPSSNWQYDEDGKPIMGGIYIDEKRYIDKHLASSVNTNGNTNTDVQIKMGHVHLKVGDINTAKEFYVDVLNFDIISMSSNVLFVSRDGYHHHLGMNTWQSLGAGKRTENVYGLYSFEFIFKDQSYFDDIKINLKAGDYHFDEISDSEFITQDPWGNYIRVRFI